MQSSSLEGVWCRLPHPGYASVLPFLSSRLGCHRPTCIPLPPLHPESQSHFPTSSSTATFLHFPSWLSQRPSCILTLPLLTFFLPLDRPHSAHPLPKGESILGSLFPSSHHSKVKKKGFCEVGGISLQIWQHCRTSCVLYLTAYLVPEVIQFNLQPAVAKSPPHLLSVSGSSRTGISPL